MIIGIYIYDDSEVLDFSGPFEVFSTASRICHDDCPFEPILLGATGEAVSARAGYLVIPHFSIKNHPALDVLIIPGGAHTDEMANQEALQWIAKQANQVSLVASVCTGAFLLAAAGVLTDQRVTTHGKTIAQLRAQFPTLDVIEGERWVESGPIVTSGGISAGIDMSLFLVSKFHSEELAVNTANHMEYDWHI